MGSKARDTAHFARAIGYWYDAKGHKANAAEVVPVTVETRRSIPRNRRFRLHYAYAASAHAWLPQYVKEREDVLASNLYFIGGGNMAEAIIAAVRKHDDRYPVDHIYVEDISEARLSYLEKTYQVTPATPRDTPDNVDIAVIAVRPQDDVTGVATSIINRFDQRTTSVVSIVAGYTIAQLERTLGSERRITRIIPNTLTTVDYGYSGVSSNQAAADAPDSVRKGLDAWLSTFGKPLHVEERLIDVITGFYPPNLVYHFIDAYVDAGVLAGLPRDISKAIALDTVIGGTELLKQRDVLPQVLLNINNSPGGVGITEAYILNKTGFAAAIQSAVLAAVERTTKLGKEAQ
jgi:pyrroline-5-carboxylate reductase